MESPVLSSSSSSSFAAYSLSSSVDEIRSISPVFPTVPVAADDRETYFLSVPKGGVPVVVPLQGKVAEGKIAIGKGVVLPKGFVPALSTAAYAPFFIGDGSWLICRRQHKGSASKDISLVNVCEGTVFTKKGLLYDYAVPMPSGDMVLLGMQSIAMSSPAQIMGLIGSKYTVIYKRLDGKLYPSIVDYAPVAAWSDDCIGTIAPSQKSFEIIKKKSERWQLLHTIPADNVLSDVTWGKKKALAVAATDNLLQFYDLAQGKMAGKITCKNIASKRLFMYDDAILIQGIEGITPAIAIIGCADLESPELLAKIPLNELSHESIDVIKIIHLIALKDHALVKTTANKSYAVGPIYSGVVKTYLTQLKKTESGK